MKTVVFQGDSITDAGRIRTNPLSLGQGYAHLVAAEMGYANPNTFTFYNRGISGDRVTDLYTRWKIDCLNLKPDYLSILIGVNDVMHEVAHQNGVEAEKFEIIYGMLLEETKKALPDVKIMLLAPFIMRYKDTEDAFTYYKEEVQKRQKAVFALGTRFGLPVISLQDAYDEALTKAPVDFWTPDGVHPTAAGHEVIARCWIDAFKKHFSQVD